MDFLSSCIFTQPYAPKISLQDNCDYDKRDGNQKTPQCVIDSLPRFTVRPNGAYSQPDYSCGICYCKYGTGDIIVCLPCRHNFHNYCIENWLKWVKDTCPVDKKSIIRRQCIDELAQERQAKISSLFPDNEPQETITLDEKSLLVCEGEGTELPNSIIKKNVREKRKQKNAQKIPQKNCVVQLLTLTEIIKSDSKKNESSITGNIQSKNILQEKRTIRAADHHRNLELNGKNCGVLSIFSSGFSKELQESIQRNIKREHLSASKPECLQSFQENHETTVTKLSSSNICPTKEQNKQKKTCPCNPYAENVEVIPHLKTKEIERDVSLRGIMGNKNLTFGDLLEIEKEVTSGWIYKMDKPNAFDRKCLKKLK